MVKGLPVLRKMSQFFYAVGVGRQVGVYTSWPECQKQVHDIANARYKKFKTHKEAIAFIQECKEKFSPLKNHSPKNYFSLTQPSCSSSKPSVSASLPCVSSTQSTQRLESERTNKTSRLLTLPMKDTVMSTQEHNAGSHTVPTSTSSGLPSPSMLDIFSQDDPFDEPKPASNLRLITNEVTSNLSNVDLTSLGEFMKKVDKNFTDLKTTLGHIMVKLHDLDTKVESLTNFCVENNANSHRVPNRVTASSIKKNLLSNYNDPQPVGKRQMSSSATENEVEVVQVPPKKIPKIELDSDDEVDGFNYDFKVDENGFVIVYTDGACENNGRKGAKAGIGVWFGDGHPLNCSEPVRGRPTNNTAEIQAAVHALEVAKRAGVKNIIIRTDSEFVINCITKWMKKWQKNGWKVASGNPVKNKEDLILLWDSMNGIDVKWEHVRGHQGIHGNEMADMLARNGAERYVA